MQKKFCPKCSLYLDISLFKKVTSSRSLKKYPDGRYWCCTDCYNKIEWVLKDGKEPNRRVRRRNKLQRRLIAIQQNYGLSGDEFIEMVNAQKNLCAICNQKEEGKVLCVDHDHVTGKVRGLLCNNCNVGLGNFRDNPKILESAIAYLIGKSDSPIGENSG